MTNKIQIMYREGFSEMLQIAPCIDSNLIAVFLDLDDEKGEVCYYTFPVEAIGVAKFVVDEYQYRVTSQGKKEIICHNEATEIIGHIVSVFLRHGLFEVCEAEDNFVGVCKKGADIEAIFGRPDHQLVRLREMGKIIPRGPISVRKQDQEQGCEIFPAVRLPKSTQNVAAS